MGGLGRDTLAGNANSPNPREADVFVLQKGVSYRGDMVGDFDLDLDRIGLLRSEFNNLGGFSFRNRTNNSGHITGAWIVWGGQDMMYLPRIQASQLNNSIFEYL